MPSISEMIKDPKNYIKVSDGWFYNTGSSWIKVHFPDKILDPEYKIVNWNNNSYDIRKWDLVQLFKYERCFFFPHILNEAE